MNHFIKIAIFHQRKRREKKTRKKFDVNYQVSGFLLLIDELHLFLLIEGGLRTEHKKKNTFLIQMIYEWSMFIIRFSFTETWIWCEKWHKSK